MTTPRRPALPYLIILSVFALMVTFGLLYVTIQAGIVAMIGLVFVLLAVGGVVSLFLSRIRRNGAVDCR